MVLLYNRGIVVAVAAYHKVQFYVTTTGGYLKRYDPETKKVVTLGKGLSRNPNSTGYQLRHENCRREGIYHWFDQWYFSG